MFRRAILNGARAVWRRSSLYVVSTFYFLEENLEKYKIMPGRVEAAAADEKAA
jgi:hypothetical protein